MENQEIQKDDSTREFKFKESWKPFWGSALLFAAIILGLFGAFMFFVVGEDRWDFLFVYLFSLLSLGLLVFPMLHFAKDCSTKRIHIPCF